MTTIPKTSPAITTTAVRAKQPDDIGRSLGRYLSPRDKRALSGPSYVLRDFFLIETLS